MATAVITGASSGIGELTSIYFARQGYDVVLAARREYALQEVADKCREYQVKTVVVQTDISQKQQVERLAARAIKEFGAIDVWVNNAGVIAYGRFLDTPPDEFRQTLETNLFGVIYGSREALTQFRAQGHGTLINVASGYGAVPAPYASAYVTSKFAVRGFTASLRQEILADHIKDIHVCTVLPATIDTPVYQSSSNRMGHAVRALPPVYPAERVAESIVALARTPKAEVTIGKSLRVPITLYSLFPGTFASYFARYVKKQGFKNEDPTASAGGNLYYPSDFLGVSGGWKQTDRRATPLMVSVVLLGLAVLITNKKKRA